MLINKPEKSPLWHVEFISYTGQYPNLCNGTLTLKIDDDEVTFGDHGTEMHPSFWASGGYCADKQSCSVEWNILYDQIPEKYQKYAEEIDNVFNVNVEYGCCGGCRQEKEL